jgi:ionotropic glutamate receptor
MNTYEKNFKFVPLIRHISKTDSFKAEQVTCELVNEGVAGIFGPNSMQTSGIVSSICNRLEIPHMIAHYEHEPMGGRKMFNAYSFNFYPEAEQLAR